MFFEQVCAGDVVQVDKLGFFPGDMLVLYHVQNDAVAARFQINTANVDGEAVPKDREGLLNAPSSSSAFVLSSIVGSSLQFARSVDSSIYQGSLEVRATDSTSEATSKQFNQDHVVLANSRLESISDFMIGIVISTGRFTKQEQDSLKNANSMKRPAHLAAFGTILADTRFRLCYRSSCYLVDCSGT